MKLRIGGAFLLLLLSASSGCSGDEPQSPETAEPVPAVDPAPLVWRFEHGPDGGLARLVKPSGKAITYTAVRREGGTLAELSRVGPDGTATHRYDDRGRRIVLEDATGRSTFAYDDLGSPISVQTPAGTVRYERDPLGRVAAADVDGWRVGVERDHLGRVVAIKTPVGTIAYRHHPGDRKIERILPNGARSVLTRDVEGRLTSIEHFRPDGSPLLAFAYAHRPDGKIREIRETEAANSKVVAYRYDLDGRLIAANDPEFGEVGFDYDAEGNRTALRRPDGGVSVNRFDWASRLLSLDGRAGRHDADGNLIGVGADSDSRHFSFDLEDRLETYRDAASNIRYRHDGDGRLVAREVAGEGAYRYLPDPTSDSWRPLLVVAPDGSKTRYLWDESGRPLAEVEGETVRFFLHDHLGSVRTTLGRDGTIVDRRSYTAFGAPRADLGRRSTPGFAGLMYDGAAGLYLAQDRAYEPTFGRFLQRDPEHRVYAGSPNDLSPYAYCGDDPVNQVDTTGAFPEFPFYRPPGHDFDMIRRVANLPGLGFKTQDPPGVVNQQRLYRATQDPAFAAAQSNLALERGGARGFVDSMAFDTAAGLSVKPGVNREQKLMQAAWVGVSTFVPGMGPVMAARTLNYAIRNGDGVDGANAVLDLALSATALRVGVAGAGLAKTELALAKLERVANLKALGEMAIRTAYAKEQKQAEQVKASRRQEGADAQGRYPGGFMAPQAVEASVKNEKEKQETKDALDQIRANQHGGPANSRGSIVGGIYLSGAGEALKSLGKLKGVHVDANGRVVLVSEERGAIEGPPVSLDDLATVFRTVYEHGAPSVSIDPNPSDPNGPIQLVRHGEGTAGTRVGWILFECDRIMKSYSVGQDNLARREVRSRIPGYDELMSIGFTERPRPDLWERFWIVRDRVERARPKAGKLTVFDVPLGVKTQSMVLRGGKLAPAPSGVSSRSAKAFSVWFAANLDAVDSETEPAWPNGDEPAPGLKVFHELRRVALTTAMAEALRDQGVPLPNWMRSWRTVPFAMPATTPAVKASRKRSVGNTETTLSTYGGVSLDAGEGKGVAERPATSGEEALAAALAKVDAAPVLSAVPIEAAGKKYAAVPLPGDRDEIPGALVLREVDLRCFDPNDKNRSISLVRIHHSFHDSEESFGPGWTLDLPRLASDRLPKERRGNTTWYEVRRRVVSPLGSITADGPFFDGLAPSLRTKTVRVEAGGTLHFDETSGTLVEIESDDGSRTSFRRDERGRLTSISLRNGDDEVASIRLSYRPDGRTASARSSLGETVEYVYDDRGRLIEARRSDGVVGRYGYDGRRLVRAGAGDAPPVVFDLDERGRLKEKAAPERPGGAEEFRLGSTVIARVGVDPKDGSRTMDFGAGTRFRETDDRDGGTKIELRSTGPSNDALTAAIDASGRIRAVEETAGTIERTTVDYDDRAGTVRIRRSDDWIESTVEESGNLTTKTSWGTTFRVATSPSSGDDRPAATLSVARADAPGRDAALVVRDGRVEEFKGFEGERFRFEHAAGPNGSPTLRSLARPDGATVRYVQDQAGRIKSVVRPGVAANYEYDESGRLHQIRVAPESPSAGR